MSLKMLRERKRVSQKELSEKTGMSTATISFFEKGKIANMRLCNFLALADFFEVTLDDLFKEISNVDNRTLSFVKNERLKRNLSQRQIREELGLNRETIRRSEKYGLEQATPKTRRKIAEFFGVTEEEAIERDYNYK